MKKYLLLLSLIFLLTGCSNTVDLGASQGGEEKIIKETVKAFEDNSMSNYGKYKQIEETATSTLTYRVDHINYPETKGHSPKRVEAYQIYFNKDGMEMSTGTVPELSYDWRLIEIATSVASTTE